MGSYQLRRFNFYDIQEVEEPPSIFTKPNNILTTINKDLTLIDEEGLITILDVELNIKYKFLPYEELGYKCTFVSEIKGNSNLILTIGEGKVNIENQNSNLSSTDQNPLAKNKLPPLIKIWELDRQTSFLNRKITLGRAKSLLPYNLKTIKINNSSSYITCFTVSRNLSYCAIGLMDGQVILIKGNIVKDRFLKQKVIHTCSEPITGLGFNDFKEIEIQTSKDDSLSPDLKQGSPIEKSIKEELRETSLHLFITTTREILSYSLDGVELKVVLDDQGCSFECAAMVDNVFHHGISMGRDDALYFYDSEGRGPCLAYEGIKNKIQWYGTQLIVLSPTHNHINDPIALRHATEEERNKTTQLEIYDVTQKLIGFTYEFPKRIKYLCWAYGGLFVLCEGGRLYRIEEKDVSTKLDILLRQDLYDLAILIAKQSALLSRNSKGDNLLRGSAIEPDELAKIYRMYGDYLYNKGEYELAMEQYISTIGYLEPSYVIRKFLDAQRLQSLTNYLQTLHKKGGSIVNSDHTTLLLNCYTKLKDQENLDSFIKTTLDQTQSFELETSIKVLRNSNYYSHALYLAQKYFSHDYVVSIMVEDLKDYFGAIEYIKVLSSVEIISYLDTYGRILLNNYPNEIVSIILKLCKEDMTLNPLDFIKLFVDSPVWSMKFLQDYCRSVFKIDLDMPNDRVEIVVSPRNSKMDYKSKNRNLEDDSIQYMVWNTLLELYLSNRDVEILKKTDEIIADNFTKELIEKRILLILGNNKLSYDINQAIVLCKLYNFNPGLVLLYEKLGMYSDILNHWIALDDVKNILETLRRYGPKDASLYTLTLEYFASSSTSLLNHPVEFRMVLDSIESQSLLPPVQVIQTLSRNSLATIGGLKQFITKAIEKDQKEIDRDLSLIESYKTENEKKKQEIEELKSNVRVFQQTKCSSCSQNLDLPAIHFMCKHSYHMRCLGQSTEECPLCRRGDQLTFDLQNRMKEEAYDHQGFIEALEDAAEENGFDFIAESFAKNTFQFCTLKE